MNVFYALLAVVILGLSMTGFVVVADQAITKFLAWRKTHPSVRLYGRRLTPEARQAMVERRLMECAEQVAAFARACEASQNPKHFATVR